MVAPRGVAKRRRSTSSGAPRCSMPVTSADVYRDVRIRVVLSDGLFDLAGVDGSDVIIPSVERVLWQREHRG